MSTGSCVALQWNGAHHWFFTDSPVYPFLEPFLPILVPCFQGNAAVSNAAAEAAEPAVAPAAHAEAPEQAWGTGAEWRWQVWKDAEGCWRMLKDVEGMEPTKTHMLPGTLGQKWDCIV